ncbi:alpha/beta hydrolase [Glaciecola siphonariae]|uniref:Alpha/beta hydrolase n=1 Tax=Glaciecola siphonariae TaxID=521012 RepID=A0ABV9LVU6_9ALTE
MYIVTNRAVDNTGNIKAFGDTPNPKGPNELRLVKVTQHNKTWRVEPLEDKLEQPRVDQLNKKFNLDINTNIPWHASLAVACDIFEQAQKQNKSILFFVHGYNNDVGDVLKTAEQLESLYNAIVVPFTWPANGGGTISGTASYLSDKADARASSGAFNRFVEKIQFFHTLMCTASLKSIAHKVEQKYQHRDNPMAAASLYTELVSAVCKVKINLLCHSMGNYLLKHSLMTSDNKTSQLVFDNINLVAGDTNNENHAQWVDKIDVRKRIYVVINENDAALRVSRIKPGASQKARLGHFLKSLNSEHCVYIDVTECEGVGNEHSYFKGEPVEQNSALKALFDDIFNGRCVEKRLTYEAAENYYHL